MAGWARTRLYDIAQEQYLIFARDCQTRSVGSRADVVPELVTVGDLLVAMYDLSVALSSAIPSLN